MASGSTSIPVGTALVDGETYYVYVQVKQNPTQASQTGGLSSGVGNKSKTTQLQASTRTAPVRTVGITAVAQTRPPV